MLCLNRWSLKVGESFSAGQKQLPKRKLGWRDCAMSLTHTVMYKHHPQLVCSLLEADWCPSPILLPIFP